MPGLVAAPPPGQAVKIPEDDERSVDHVIPEM
jgi:hypothetical protein